MKLMIGLLFLSHTVFAKVASVPSSWIGSSSSMTSFKTNSFLQTNELEESYKGLIDYNKKSRRMAEKQDISSILRLKIDPE
jgi:hypothetical protein